ncbi:hypothetical protein NA56DRAFT_747708 [Hyaloscypha hepaticicola]|uniref:2EXR domain-containing protein n=1 Tax=Hyaloscypha hepaticicola TaxID=2082293 RepID=A0A2J6Q814_9HELO|nr:hypothetical protein NA56DRAFT_747708 [Hyaloscypha hepaticicola]
MSDQPSTIPYHESEPTTLCISKYSLESPAIMASMIESLNRGVSKLSVTLASKGEDIFYPFPKLPTEIRLQIWQRAIDALPGRIIDVTSVIHQNESGDEYRFVSHRACPSLAGVNREARATVFKIYTPLFPPGTKHSFITACLEKDTILLSTGTRHPKYI